MATPNTGPGGDKPAIDLDKIAALPKAELHCHLEGTVSPHLAVTLAARHGLDISHIINPDGSYKWQTFNDFLSVYDVMAQCVRTPEDYYDILLDYYDRAAAQGLIYGEMFVSSDHPETVGISYPTFLDTLESAADEIKAKHGVEVRYVLHVVRHYGVEAAKRVVDLAHKHPSPRVTGFGIAGDEAVHEHKAFAFAFAAAREAGLGCTAHAGEHLGPESVRAALDHLGAARIGHGVRAIEDAALTQRLAEEGIVLEVCPSSNICLGVAQSHAHHPLSRLADAGVKVTLNSDDPPFFFTDIGKEYALAAQHYDFDEQSLMAMTRAAICAGFCDEKTRIAALERLDAQMQDKAHI